MCTLCTHTHTHAHTERGVAQVCAPESLRATTPDNPRASVTANEHVIEYTFLL